MDHRGGRWLWSALDALLPPACAGCGVPAPAGQVLCERCEALLAPIAADACPRCQLHREGGACATIAPLDAAIATVWLEPPVIDWIHAFKYPPRGLRGLAPDRSRWSPSWRRDPRGARPVPRPSSSCPCRCIRGGCARADSTRRSSSRAQSRERLQLRSPRPVLERVRNTPSQTGLNAAERRRNVRGALRARRPVPARVWIVDDVITTGATLREAARMLVGAGAEEVIAIAAARTPRER
jgi:predicted amidophosphoribosyltransferase